MNMKDKMTTEDLQRFFDLMGEFFGKQHNVKVTYTIRKKTEEELARSKQEKEDAPKYKK